MKKLQGQRALAAGLLVAVLAIAGWETAAGLWRRASVPSQADWQAAAHAVRADFRPGDLIVIAPRWADPLGRAELGDLMPETMVGRPDNAPYARIFELSIRGARAEDSAGLLAEWTQPFGGVKVARYKKEPVQVLFDLVEQALSARVAQRPLAATGRTLAEPVPCLWEGPRPAPQPPVGAAGAFRCAHSRVEKRMLEIDYRPRYGISVELAANQETLLSWEDIPDEAWNGQLVLWFGLHDYHARKNARGPAEVVVDLDDGKVRVPLHIEPDRGLEQLRLALPKNPEPRRAQHAIRIELSAQSAPHHFVGVLGRLEQVRK